MHFQYFPVCKVSMLFFSLVIFFPDISRHSFFSHPYPFPACVSMRFFLFNTYKIFSRIRHTDVSFSFLLNIKWTDFFPIYPKRISSFVLFFWKTDKQNKIERCRKLVFNICAQSQEEAKTIFDCFSHASYVPYMYNIRYYDHHVVKIHFPFHGDACRWRRIAMERWEGG